MANNFVAKQFLDSSTGEAHRIYTYKLKPCRRVVLSSRLCTHLSGYTLIEKDLRSVLFWLEEIEKRHVNPKTEKRKTFRASTDRENYNLIKGLFVAAITFYGKCFSKCEGRPVKLERAQLDPKFHELHDECISYRHNFAAHSGSTKIERVDVALVSLIKFGGSVTFQIYKELHQPDLMWPQNPTLIHLVEHVRLIADHKAKLLEERIRTEEVVAKAAALWEQK